jgi:hypothetical protein
MPVKEYQDCTAVEHSLSEDGQACRCGYLTRGIEPFVTCPNCQYVQEYCQMCDAKLSE